MRVHKYSSDIVKEFFDALGVEQPKNAGKNGFNRLLSASQLSKAREILKSHKDEHGQASRIPVPKLKKMVSDVEGDEKIQIEPRTLNTLKKRYSDSNSQFCRKVNWTEDALSF